MTICAKFGGRRIEDCTRGEGCICAVEEERLKERMLDTSRLDWLEMLTVPTEDIDDLIRNWRVNGKRYPTGLRDAIDAAMERWPYASIHR